MVDKSQYHYQALEVTDFYLRTILPREDKRQ